MKKQVCIVSVTQFTLKPNKMDNVLTKKAKKKTKKVTTSITFVY